MESNITYRVIIEKTTTATVPGREWKKLHDLPSFDKDTNPQYGYVKTDVVETNKVDVFNQTIADPAFDLKRVICAVNNLQIDLQK